MEVKITVRNGECDCIDNHDLAVFADWAGQQEKIAASAQWKWSFSLIRHGAALVLRQRTQPIRGNDKKEAICK